MKTQVSTDRNSAVELLRQGEAVALPTETVYGLAADALNPIAVAKIFEAKGRPRFDPLIIHLPDPGWLEKVADPLEQDRRLVSSLAEKFWPGPFTMVLPKRDIIPEIVTAGLETVAVRISAHPIFSEIVSAFGKPLSAPSANRFGRISPTTAKHVLDELNGHIPLIIDAGPTTHGIESTIVAVHDGKIDIERVELAQVAKPGQLPSHYAPKTPLRIVDNLKSFTPMTNERYALLAWTPIKNDERFVAIRNLSRQQDLREAAANLFRYLRELDALDVDLIVAERVPGEGLGAAILDRLQRASHG
ncbi:MAG: threonylcarbamoyl-AMP synthase [Verrucomicrobia bacterium]|nr:MAG: threonylcarbamoyl-AMP synthase [Verrucomicrobiota bacterium]